MGLSLFYGGINMKKRFVAWILCILMASALLSATAAFAAGEPVLLGKTSGRVFPVEASYAYSWKTYPDNTPVLDICPNGSTEMDDAKESYLIPIRFSANAPSEVESSAYPYYRYRYSTDKTLHRLQPDSPGDSYMTLSIPVSAADLKAEGELGDTIDIFWFAEDDVSTAMLHQECLQYTIENPKEDPFATVPKVTLDRLTVSFDELIGGENKSVTWAYNESKGILTFTIEKPLTTEQLRALYAPGLANILGGYSISAPAGYDRVWNASGNMSYADFTSNYNNPDAAFINNNRVGNAIYLWQLDLTDTVLTASPMRTGRNEYLCWKDAAGNLYPEMLTVNTIVKDESKTDLPASELPTIPTIPSDRVPVAKHLPPVFYDKTGCTFSYDEAVSYTHLTHMRISNFAIAPPWAATISAAIIINMP